MYRTIQAPVRLFAPTWSLDALRSVRDALQSAPADKLIDDRDALAVALSEAIGALSARDTTKGRALDDDPATWPAYVLPPLSGGAPAYEPTAEEYADYARWSEQLERKQRAEWMARMDLIGEGVEADSHDLTERDVIRVTGCC